MKKIDIIEYLNENENQVSRLNQYMNSLDEKNNIITLLDMLKGANTVRQLYYNLKYVVALCSMGQMTINFFNIPMFLDSLDDFVIPEKMELCMYSDIEQNVEAFYPGVKFNPNEILFSETEKTDSAGIYILYPIFSGETVYGYLTCKIKKNKFADYGIYLKIIISAIASAFEYTNKLVETERLVNRYSELEEDNKTLSKQSRIDVLTGIFNRRGFYELGQRTLDIVQEMEHAGIIFYADMDNLKKINDTYGHDMGDMAIKIMAEIFKNVFRINDVVARLGGDEFGIVAPGMIIEQVPLIRKKIDDACKTLLRNIVKSNLSNEKISRSFYMIPDEIIQDKLTILYPAVKPCSCKRSSSLLFNSYGDSVRNG